MALGTCLAQVQAYSDKATLLLCVNLLRKRAVRSNFHCKRRNYLQDPDNRYEQVDSLRSLFICTSTCCWPWRSLWKLKKNLVQQENDADTSAALLCWQIGPSKLGKYGSTINFISKHTQHKANCPPAGDKRANLANKQITFQPAQQQPGKNHWTPKLQPTHVGAGQGLGKILSTVLTIAIFFNFLRKS